MFEKRLQKQIEKIFDLGKVTYDSPSESQEQEGVFIQVASSAVRVTGAKAIAKVEGTIRVFAASNKLPYGFFAKQIDSAKAEDKAGLFFHNFEENKGKYRNIVERSVAFVYLFDGQYDPAMGRIETVNIQILES